MEGVVIVSHTGSVMYKTEGCQVLQRYSFLERSIFWAADVCYDVTGRACYRTIGCVVSSPCVVLATYNIECLVARSKVQAALRSRLLT